jgi:dihydroorotate dehydrogenase (fumarate)
MTQDIYSVGGINLKDAPIMIGAGVCKNPAVTDNWLKVAPVVSGSYTPEPRAGNTGNHLFHPETLESFLEQGSGLNSFGMPNAGFDSAAKELRHVASDHALIASVAGFCVEDYLLGVKTFSKVKRVKAIELNFGCPNTDHGKILSFDPRTLSELFDELCEHDKKPVWVKFSPYSDPGLLKEVAGIVNTISNVVRAVVTCNTFPNAYAGAQAISPNNGLAGLSGPAMKPIALGQVRQFRQHLQDDVDVIGVGGITIGNDAPDFFDAGAAAVQLTSFPFWLGSPGQLWEHLLNAETGNRLGDYLNQ